MLLSHFNLRRQLVKFGYSRVVFAVAEIGMQEFMFDVDATPIDPELLDFTGKNNRGKSGGRGLIFSQERGRYVKPMIPRGKVGHSHDMLYCRDAIVILCERIVFCVTDPQVDIDLFVTLSECAYWRPGNDQQNIAGIAYM